jgi:SpoVK/Ycf46/Vps4 family AAA+-type ATPase
MVRLALEGKQRDVSVLAKKNIRLFSKLRPDLVDDLKELISSGNSKLIRDDFKLPLPVDIDSRLELLRRDFVEFEHDPIWPPIVSSELTAVIEERRLEDQLINNGLFPTRTILFVGPPGVGKTLAAKWLSYQLNRPLLTLDLAAVMSSYLGRTGNNIRAVLNYAQNNSSVLLLDEFDAIAKRRNDDSEVGELKRLVTVLLQTVDDWPSDGLLIAATNHPELLDPAVWRRFERVVEFPTPSKDEISTTIQNLLPNENELVSKKIIEILSISLEGVSFAEVTRQINIARRESIIKKIDLNTAFEEIVHKNCKSFDKSKKLDISDKLAEAKISQRKISEITGLSRDTIRKHLKNTNNTNLEMGE